MGHLTTPAIVFPFPSPPTMDPSEAVGWSPPALLWLGAEEILHAGAMPRWEGKAHVHHFEGHPGRRDQIATMAGSLSVDLIDYMCGQSQIWKNLVEIYVEILWWIQIYCKISIKYCWIFNTYVCTHLYIYIHTYNYVYIYIHNAKSIMYCKSACCGTTAINS